MKKILSTFLLSAMLVLVLGACADGHTHLYGEGLDHQDMGRFWEQNEEARKELSPTEHRETMREMTQQLQIEKLEEQVWALTNEVRMLYKPGSWRYSPFRSDDAWREWRNDDYRRYRCPHDDC